MLSLFLSRDKVIRKLVELAWSSAALIVVAATILPLIRSQDWWIRWFDFPRVQTLVVGVVLAGSFLLWGLPMSRSLTVLLASLLLSIFYQAYCIFPYTRLAPVQVKSAAPDEHSIIVRILTANIYMYNREADKYLQLLAEVNPDIVLTTENDQWWTDRLKVLDTAYPHQVKYPLDNTYGMMLHSKFPLIKPAVRFLVEPAVPSIHSVIQLPNNQKFFFIGLHPEPPGPTKSPETTKRDAELIIVGKLSKRLKLPVIVLGDLNDVAWSHTTRLFHKISCFLDPRIGRGMYNTFHADHFFLRFPLDHIFHSSHFQLTEMRRLQHIGSDHFPFYAVLSFKPRESTTQQPSPPKSDELEEADEILKKANEKKL